MMSSSRDNLLCLISCFGGSSTGGGRTGGAGGSVGVGIGFWGGLLGALADFAGLTVLIETLISLLGMTALAIFVGAAVLNFELWLVFFTLTSGAVVEVPQSEQLSL